MVDGAVITTQQYFDEKTKRTIDVDLTVRDHIFFRLLEKLIGVVSE